MPQACQLLQTVLEDIATSKTTITHQSQRSPCPSSKLVHTWAKLWEPKTSLYIQNPKDNEIESRLRLRHGQKYQPNPLLLPHLKQSKQITITSPQECLSEINKTTKVFNEFPRRLVKVANIEKIDALPIVSAYIHAQFLFYA